MLQVNGLTVEFQTDGGVLRAADGVSFCVESGKSLGLVGESGCGKSVSAMSIPRLVPTPPGRIVSGEVLLDGVDLLKVPISEMRRIRGKEIGVIFQEPMTALSPLHRIGEQLMEVLMLHTDLNRKQQADMALDWLKKVGIPCAEERMMSYPFELSGGMQQRVMIAMALMLQPKLIIADEPTTALDVTIQAQILDLIREVRASASSLLMITHDMGVIWDVCDTMAVMYASRIVETGAVKEVFAHPYHPYSSGLMASIPALAKKAGKLPHIKGSVPSLLALPKGCAFADRCPHAQAKCRECRPVLAEVGDTGRQVACHFPLL